MYSHWHLRQILACRAIDTSNWFKSVETLYANLYNQEIELILVNNQLFLRVESVRVIVYSPDRTLVLEDDYQIRHTDGTKRSKTMLRRSVSEKMYLDRRETPTQAAYRAICEELYGSHDLAKVTQAYTLHPLSVDTIMGTDKDFTGLNFVTTDYVFETIMPKHAFDRAGYAEIQSEKTIYFNWYPVSAS